MIGRFGVPKSWWLIGFFNSCRHTGKVVQLIYMEYKDYIAFKGSEFTVEWYFDLKGKSMALDYFESMNEKQQIKLLELFALMGNTGEIRNKEKFNNEGDKIYAFKPQPHRFLCFFFEEGKIIVTHAFYKKTQKLPKNEKEKALSLKKDYEMRIKRGDYYE